VGHGDVGVAGEGVVAPFADAAVGAAVAVDGDMPCFEFTFSAVQADACAPVLLLSVLSAFVKEPCRL
jgi:hypothetical protein